MRLNKNKSFFESAKNALCGFYDAFLLERNIKIDTGAVLFVIFLGYEYGVTRVEGALLAFAMAFVLMSELFNTAVEKGLDAITTDYNKNIKLSKDICAAAVSVAALCAVACAIFVFSDTIRLAQLYQKITSMPQKLIKFGIIIIFEAFAVFRKDKTENGK